MTTVTPAQCDALEAQLRERAETLRDDPGCASALDECAADAIRSLRDELADAQAWIDMRATNTIASLQTITRAALNQVAERDARIAVHERRSYPKESA